MARTYFGTDGIRGPGGPLRHHPRLRAASGACRGPCAAAQGSPCTTRLKGALWHAHILVPMEFAVLVGRFAITPD
ncbi:hypothetical protein, partial [Escherichia coli]|uniref:hypothetical protein n=1 Tax=Escherichia coli TaxID=562 RepID=UPI001BC8809D